MRSSVPCKKSWCTVLWGFFSLGHLCFLVLLLPISLLLWPQSLSDNLTCSTEKGRGESIGCNAISLKTRGKAQIIVSQQFCTELLVIPDLLFELDSSHSSCLSDPHLDYMYSSWFPIRFSQIDWDKSIISFRICICMDLKPLSHSSLISDHRVLKCDVINLQIFPLEPLNLIMWYTHMSSL